MCIDEAGHSTDERELSMLQLLPPIIGELSDQTPLPLEDLLPSHLERTCAQTKLCGAPDRNRATRRGQQGLARHAAPQDAQATEFPGTVDHDRIQPKARGGARCGISRAPAADDREIVVHNLSGSTT